MAISETHYRLLRELRDRGALPQGGRILEIGKANWYGDMDPRQILRDFYDGQPIVADTRQVHLENAIRKDNRFEIVRALYRLLLEAEAVVSIDMDPAADGALHLDLNDDGCWMVRSLSPSTRFELAINHGTAEHIFNIANVFRIMHDATVEGGLMIHESPFTGWIDHGFYSLHPTLFYDLAHANGYEMVMVALEHLASKSAIICESREQILDMARRDQLPYNAMLFVAMRKGADAPFKVPMQGVYAGTVSEQTQAAWRELR